MYRVSYGNEMANRSNSEIACFVSSENSGMPSARIDASMSVHGLYTRSARTSVSRFKMS